jgi:tellurite resistance protein TerC
LPESYLLLIFAIVFIPALCLDLFVFQRKAHVIPVREALKLVGFWVGLSLAFGVLVYVTQGSQKGVEFFTAYLVEYSLSIDNLFVFLAIFTYFAVPREAQRKVLLWGIIGAIVFRGIFIFVGIALVERFQFLLYLLGAVLIYTAIRLLAQKDKEVNPDKNPIVRLARRFVRVHPTYEGTKFFTRVDGLRYVTPLLIVLISIETMDIMFATDSVPAVFGITLDSFIVYTSNIFAILGLRALYFALAGIFHLFRYLIYGLCLVLGFVGVKMLLHDVYQIPTLVSLGVIFGLIACSVLASVIFPKKKPVESAAVAKDHLNKETKDSSRS